MPVLVDTNILLVSVQPNHSLHRSAVSSLTKLAASGQTLFVSQQNLAEFWNVATRPVANNGLGYSVSETRLELDRICDLFPPLCESPESLNIWKRLVTGYQVKGVQVHDARLVSVMLAHSVSSILTLNGSDFVRYSGIQVLSPA
ncbi:MAG: type II toxin-antitoxin system VapC family toxin [bacterium]